jgi:hypothetical protein
VGSGVAAHSATAGKEAISLRRGTKSWASFAESFSEGFIRFDANSVAILIVPEQRVLKLRSQLNAIFRLVTNSDNYSIFHVYVLH